MGKDPHFWMDEGMCRLGPNRLTWLPISIPIVAMVVPPAVDLRINESEGAES